MDVHIIPTIHDIPARDWNGITGTDYPFIRHEFFVALEDSGATNKTNGWHVKHIIVKDEAKNIVAVMPLYLKDHSYGEFVFDWSWADAYYRSGLHYYPKLLTAIPFTPVTGPRLCMRDGRDVREVQTGIVRFIRTLSEEAGASSWHLLFADETSCRQWEQLGIRRRLGVQFHWYNHGYKSFDDFLATFTSRKRKNIRKERKGVADQGLRLETLEGADISAAQVHTFYAFYQLNYVKHSGHGGYLSERFFQHLVNSLPEQILMILAKEGNHYVAGALCFKGDNTLFGRYWGCMKEFEFLHFEVCYYQGIDYCINHGLSRFDPGAGGEHKIQRGFVPVRTWSNHWIKHPLLGRAIEDFLIKEEAGMAEYLHDAMTLLPFRKNESDLK
jgi:predicted N-acyltransferase